MDVIENRSANAFEINDEKYVKVSMGIGTTIENT